jgi:hypothetical protein
MTETFISKVLTWLGFSTIQNNLSHRTRGYKNMKLGHVSHGARHETLRSCSFQVVLLGFSNINKANLSHSIAHAKYYKKIDWICLST